jgi:fatty-acid peroxygenase
MPALPRNRGFDHTAALLREGYDFIGNRCERLRTDMFETRLMLRRVVCMRGSAAAEIFYDGHRFTRVGAMPITVLKLLQDFGSVQLLDGSAHRHRKHMFLAIGAPVASAQLAASLTAELVRRRETWPTGQTIAVFDEIRTALTRAVLRWAGLAMAESGIAKRQREFSEMIEATGTIGPRNWRALLLRRRSERWARRVITAVRSGACDVPADSAIRAIAAHKEPDGRLLAPEVAAVELLNVFRPVVAVARFVVFGALALHRQPQTRERIASGDEAYLDAFVEEVRRTTPFFPFIGGRVREAFTWRGHRFAAGDWVLLDLYGTNHDSRRWPEPAAFRPERFLDRAPGLYDFVPQGAGDRSRTHRCPGERMTIDLVKAALRFLAALHYTVPDQDLTVDRARIPALPRSGLVITPLPSA